MNLFINAISTKWKLILFDDKRNIISELSCDIKWNESSLLIWIIDNFLKENILEYKNIQNIVVVNWPWSFTWVRTITLLVNTISFITKSKLTNLSYFDMFKDYPVIKSSSKRDSFFKKDKESNIEIITNDDLELYSNTNWIKTIYWDGELKNVQIIEKIDYYDIIANIELKNNLKIDPLYIKKPNIS